MVWNTFLGKSHIFGAFLLSDEAYSLECDCYRPRIHSMLSRILRDGIVSHCAVNFTETVKVLEHKIASRGLHGLANIANYISGHQICPWNVFYIIYILKKLHIIVNGKCT